MGSVCCSATTFMLALVERADVLLGLPHLPAFLWAEEPALLCEDETVPPLSWLFYLHGVGESKTLNNQSKTEELS